MKLAITLGAVLAALGAASGQQPPNGLPDPGRVPVLVELFTSEGCSSCPPADKLLETLDSQPVSGADIIVLSEHVDYWNHIGWRDPYSSRFYSDRQNAYAKSFGLEGPYTPQLVVDGASEFIGSDRARALGEISTARNSNKIAVHLSAVTVEPDGTLKARVQTGSLRSTNGSADIYLVIALDRAQSQVKSGENAGRTLSHVAVVTSITKIGSILRREFLQDVRIPPGNKASSGNLRVVAFIQEAHQGKILGATSARIPAE